MKSITVILLSGETISYSVEGSIKFFDGQLSFYSPVLKKRSGDCIYQYVRFNYKLMKLLIFGILLLSSCTKIVHEEPVDNIIYTQDPETGLCFALLKSEVGHNFYVTSISYVPCDSIKQFIK